MPIENRKKSFYFEVSQKSLILIQICVSPDTKKTSKAEKYKWFTEKHLLKLMQRLKDISLARILCDDTIEEPKDISEVLQGADFNFHMKYFFKKRGIKQFVLTQSNLSNIYGQQSLEKLNYSGGGHIQFNLYPEKLVVYVSMEPIGLDAKNDSKENITTSKGNTKVMAQMLKSRKEKSKYFNKDTESKLTSSAVKKQANLRSIINKMKQSEVEKDSTVSTNEGQQPENHSPNSVATDHINKEDEGISKITSSKEDHSRCDNNSSRKRLRHEVDHSEDTGSESQHSEKERDKDVVTKKPLSRKKRQKCLNDETKKDSEAKESCEQSQDNQCLLDTASVITEMTPSTSKQQPDHTKDTLINTSTVELSKETNFEDLQEVNDGSVEQEEIQEPSRQDDVPTVVVVDDNKRRKHETITINDATPCFKNIKEVSDLTQNHIEFLVQKLTKKLKNIFKGKDYCRRHEDYKKGGRSKGDLAFQVRFGLYSEDQHDIIMTELMSIFCARHNKYIDYISKVLLPETFVLIYMQVFGGNHDDVERLLMGNDKRQIDSQTDGSSTE